MYVTRWEEFEILNGVFEAIKLLNNAGLLTIIITNQRGIARGLMSDGDLIAIHERFQKELHGCGAHLDAIYYCPHDVDSCDCRKPKTGLFERSLRDFPEICFKDSFVIGDSLSDIQAGNRLGCYSILIASGDTTLVHSKQAQGISDTLYSAVCGLILQPARSP
jgi:D-glycero-D-manno-heptose 1,7-bisphosphate phosphatase